MELFLFLITFAKFNREGAELRAYCQRYKIYIEKTERYKLDFANNPDSGVQYYLANVPFAAIFGYLDQFEKYVQSAFPQSLENSDLHIGSNLSASFHSTNFYTSSGGSNSSSSGSVLVARPQAVVLVAEVAAGDLQNNDFILIEFR